MGANRKWVHRKWVQTGSWSKQEVDPNRKWGQTLEQCTLYFKVDPKPEVDPNRKWKISWLLVKISWLLVKISWLEVKISWLLVKISWLVVKISWFPVKISWRKKSADAKNQLTQKISWRKYPKYWKKKVYSAGPWGGKNQVFLQAEAKHVVFCSAEGRAIT